MKVLGIDYGDKKIGIAIANTKNKIALGLCVVKNNKELQSIINKENPDKIIIGIPLNSKGEQTKQAKKIIADSNKLKCKATEFIDESFTTQLSKGQKDKSAAVLILQAWLDML